MMELNLCKLVAFENSHLTSGGFWVVWKLPDVRRLFSQANKLASAILYEFHGLIRT